MHPDVLRAVAGTLKIVDHETGELTRWIPNAGQCRFWDECYRHPWVYALKGRQYGLSTAQRLNDLLFIIRNKAHRIELWLVWDKEENVAAQMRNIIDFVEQLGVRAKTNELDITFPNGSAIRGLTAGGSRVGASQSAQYLHLSEMPNWPDCGATWASLLQSLGLSGRVVLETTMLLGSALPRQLWDDPNNNFHKVFLAIEDHVEYRGALRPDGLWDVRGSSGPIQLREDVEKFLREEGLTRRDTMAYLQFCLDNKVEGHDRITLLREYPQKPSHCFNLAIGRWTRADPVVLKHRPLLVGNEVVKVYKEPSETSGHLVAGVDSAGGTGRDSNVMALLDAENGALVASYVDAHSTLAELLAVCLAVQELYTMDAPWQWGTRRPAPLTPLFLIEKNGIGGGTVQLANTSGLNFQGFDTKEDSKQVGMLLAKQRIEDGTICGPEELLHEAISLHTADGKFKGKKDLHMAIGFALRHIEENPIRTSARQAEAAPAVFRPDTRAKPSGFAKRL